MWDTIPYRTMWVLTGLIPSRWFLSLEKPTPVSKFAYLLLRNLKHRSSFGTLQAPFACSLFIWPQSIMPSSVYQWMQSLWLQSLLQSLPLVCNLTRFSSKAVLYRKLIHESNTIRATNSSYWYADILDDRLPADFLSLVSEATWSATNLVFTKRTRRLFHLF